MAKKLHVNGVFDPNNVVKSVNGIGPDDKGNVNIEILTIPDVPTDDHINSLIDQKIAAIPNAEEASF